MRSLKVVCLSAYLLLTTFVAAQALMPEEIQDAAPHRLQLKYFGDLRAIGTSVDAHAFPYHFYFSRVLDISEKDQAKADQRSIRFERFHDYTVLAISGNYFAAYSGELTNKNERAKRTLDDVVRPMLEIAVPHFTNDDSFDGFAIEIAQHVRGKVMGLPSENAENLLYYFPRAAAQHLVNARTPDAVQGAILEAKIFVDAEPFNVWVNGDRPSDQPETYANARPWSDTPAPVAAAPAVVEPTVSRKLIKPVETSRLITPKVLDDLKAEYAAEISRLERDLREQVHFAGYVTTQFVGFHEGAYLELSIMVDVPASAETSRYKIAALAFDDSVSHLVRASLAHFQDASNFDGIVYSVIAKPTSSQNAVAVEYFLPFQPIRAYARYDMTGQDLLDSGYVLINGERSSLNLQSAESPNGVIASK